MRVFDYRAVVSVDGVRRYASEQIATNDRNSKFKVQNFKNANAIAGGSGIDQEGIDKALEGAKGESFTLSTNA